MKHTMFRHERSNFKLFAGLTEQKSSVFLIPKNQIDCWKRTTVVVGRFRFEMASLVKPPSLIAKLAKYGWFAIRHLVPLLVSLSTLLEILSGSQMFV